MYQLKELKRNSVELVGRLVLGETIERVNVREGQTSSTRNLQYRPAPRLDGGVPSDVRRYRMHCVNYTSVAQAHGPSCAREDVWCMAGSEEMQESA